jgi:spore germination protein YaaH
METPFVTWSVVSVLVSGGTRRRALTAIACVVLTLLMALRCLAAAQKPQAVPKRPAVANAARAKWRWQVLGARPLAMYYYYPDNRGLDSLEQHASQVTLVGPQCFTVDAGGFVRGEVPPNVLEIARRAHLPVMPLLVNPGFDRSIARELLRSPRAQERTAIYLAYLAKRDNFVGWQLDLENLDPIDKRRYTAFVARVGARLHRDGRLLSVAVVPRFSDSFPGTDPSGSFRTGEWGAPYDFRALGALVDFMTLMTYDHHGKTTPPGPVAGYDWVKAALRYAVVRVPRPKLLLGIPFYGREWVSGSEATTTRNLSFRDVTNQLECPEVESHWDEEERAAWFQYHDTSGLHTGWYEDSKSLEEKLRLMQQYRLRGFAAWRLGAEDPKFWTLALATPLSRRRGTMANGSHGLNRVYPLSKVRTKGVGSRN